MNYYERLGVSYTASTDEINKAYKKLVLIHHPDRKGDEAIFKEINNAAEVLRDETKRRTYDHYLNTHNHDAAVKAVNRSTAASSDASSPPFAFRPQKMSLPRYKFTTREEIFRAVTEYWEDYQRSGKKVDPIIEQLVSYLLKINNPRSDILMPKKILDDLAKFSLPETLKQDPITPLFDAITKHYTKAERHTQLLMTMVSPTAQKIHTAANELLKDFDDSQETVSDVAQIRLLDLIQEFFNPDKVKFHTQAEYETLGRRLKSAEKYLTEEYFESHPNETLIITVIEKAKEMHEKMASQFTAGSSHNDNFFKEAPKTDQSTASDSKPHAGPKA